MDWSGNIVYQPPYEQRPQVEAGWWYGGRGEARPVDPGGGGGGGGAGGHPYYIPTSDTIYPHPYLLDGPVEDPWQFQGPNGEPWHLQDAGGERWLPQDPNGEVWQPREPGRERWLPQDPNGEVWQPREPGGERWLPQDPNGDVWQPREPGGERWLPQDPNGEVWQPREPGGERWLPQGPDREIWQTQGWPDDYGGAPNGYQEALGHRNHPPPPEKNGPGRGGQAQDFKDAIITADVNLPRLAVASSSPYVHKPKKSVHGLPNLGNTSYMNAVLQCLYHTSELTEFFYRGISWDDINERSSTKGEVALAYGQVLEALESGKGKEETLRNLQRVCGDYDERFQGQDHKEANDFLASLLHWLHQDLATGDLTCACLKRTSSKQHRKVKWKTQEPSDRRALPGHPRASERQPGKHHLPGANNAPTGARRSAEAPQNSNETTGAQEPTPRNCRVCGVQKENGSIISDLFVGIHESTTICLTSGTIICRTYERFTSLTLSVNLMGEMELVEALKHHYRSQEILCQCVYCGREHLCQQETRILSLPRVLLLNLSRYNPQQQQDRRVSRVSFPDEGLGLDDHLATELIPRGRRFSLTSVCNHHGSTTRGHYTACCRSRRQNRLLPQSWRLFDDDHVEPIRNFRSPYEAYLLFYECLND